MAIDAKQVMELRERCGAGVLDCKKALAETDGDVEKAVELLLKKGIAAAAKKAGRIASDGLIYAYIHQGSKIGVLVEVNCETDFVAKTEGFKAFANDICLQIAANNPLFVNAEDVDAALVAKQREIFTAQAQETKKPAPVIAKIVDGKVAKWLNEVCLLTQPFLKDTEKTVDEVRKELIAKLGENVVIRRFVRYELGEGIEKPVKADYADEIAKMTEGK